MGKINILQPNVFNMLAAGEVVEGPSSVVKELVENALDAGATKVDIKIENGGIGKIQISDNGIGILPEDMKSAFLPHATSKIKNIVDLDELSTLGFRGEALASIASVSEVTMISHSKFSGKTSKIRLSGGNVVFEGIDSRDEGTVISVENLFFNTPARLKFLKKPSSEARDILDVVRMLVLANPTVSFSLEDEDGTLLAHESGSLIDAVCSVYGIKTVEKLIELKPNESGTIRISGFISSVDFTKPNRTYQTIVVNGRAVEDVTVRTAVEKAYGDYLMKRAYPMFVLDVVMPFDEVDANVHPRKTEVRFRDKQKVFGAVYHAVSDCIAESVKRGTVGLISKEDKAAAQFNSEHRLNDGSEPKNESLSDNFHWKESCGGQAPCKNEREAQIRLANKYGSEVISVSSANSENDTDKIETPAPEKPSRTLRGAQIRIDTSAFYHGKTVPNYPARSLKDGPTSVLSNFEPNQTKTSSEEAEQEELRVFDGKIIGQVFATYLLVERDEKFYIIDQHAAHERILYDKIVSRFSSEYSQPLLAPYELSLTGSEEEYLERSMDALNKIGFEFVKKDRKYFVTAVPDCVSDMNFGTLFGDIFDKLLDEGELTLSEILKSKLCQRACKAAIKGGEALSREQIQRVLTNYLDESGNLPSKCPHGRPAVIVLDKKDFEKMFKRIV